MQQNKRIDNRPSSYSPVEIARSRSLAHVFYAQCGDWVEEMNQLIETRGVWSDGLMLATDENAVSTNPICLQDTCIIASMQAKHPS
jgi:hypothetical protein